MATTTTSSSSLVVGDHDDAPIAEGSSAPEGSQPTAPQTLSSPSSSSSPGTPLRTNTGDAAKEAGATAQPTVEGEVGGGSSSSDRNNNDTQKNLPLSSSSTTKRTSSDDTDPSSSSAAQWLVEATLHRMTDGLPRSELLAIVSESEQCETQLEEEIRLLERAQLLQQQQQPQQTKTTKKMKRKKREKRKKGGDDEDDADGNDENAMDEDDDPDDVDDDNDGNAEALQSVLESPFTPLDAVWTASALLGRLRGELSLPRHPALEPWVPTTTTTTSTTTMGPTSVGTGTTGGNNNNNKGAGGGESAATIVAAPPPNHLPRQLLELQQHPHYKIPHDNPHILLALHKKVSAHRSAAVFRRPVKVDEAPGYDARILFPMDLSMVRKQILARQINSYADLHRRLGLIAFNCLKFNGRESDYGAVAKDFERAADEMVWHAVTHHGSSSTLAGGVMVPPLPPPSSTVTGRSATPATAVASTSDVGGGGGAPTPPTIGVTQVGTTVVPTSPEKVGAAAPAVSTRDTQGEGRTITAPKGVDATPAVASSDPPSSGSKPDDAADAAAATDLPA